MDRKVSSIYKSMDYNQFRYCINRPVNAKRVNELKESMTKNDRLIDYPIQVKNEDNYLIILDGQHRFAAAKEINHPIYYTVTESMAIEDIAEANRLSKHWSLDDYLNFYAGKGDEMSKWILTTSKSLGVTSHLLLVIGGLYGKNYWDALKSGAMKFNPERTRYTLKIYHLAKSFEPVFEHWKNRWFIIAIRQLAKCKDYDHAQMEKKFKYMSRSFVRCASVNQYIEMLEEIYNHKNRIKITIPKM